MKRLKDNLTSGYIASANQLKPKNAPHKIIVYVEGYEDVFFWRNVLQDFETEKIRFQVMLPSRTSLQKGKKAALMNDLGPRLGEYMIACVDADYDWLMQGGNDVSRMLCFNPYVLHTYVYAIENYQCYAPSLHTACVMSTLNDKPLVDIPLFIKNFSEIIWPLFVWSIWVYRYDHCAQFRITDFCDTVAIREVNPYNLTRTLELVQRRVNRKVAWLQRQFPQAKKTYVPLREELESLGLKAEDTYLYMHGHTLFERVVLSVLNPVCVLLRRNMEREINKLAAHSVHLQNELSNYHHSQCPIEEALKHTVDFKESFPYQLLKADIIRLIAEVGLQK